MKVRFGILCTAILSVYTLSAAIANDSVIVNLSVIDDLDSETYFVNHDNLGFNSSEYDFHSIDNSFYPPAPEAKFPIVEKNKVASPKKTTNSKPIEKTVLQEPLKEAIKEETIETLSPEEEKELKQATENLVEVKEIIEEKEAIESDKNTIVEDDPIIQNEDNEAIEDMSAGLDVSANEVVTIKDHFIRFEDNIIELDDTNKNKLLDIVASFDNLKNSKIGIYSYNPNSKEDAFKKKRQSLNRASEIRTFLLSQGYKSFNIKIINIDPASEKINSVEIVEIK